MKVLALLAACSEPADLTGSFEAMHRHIYDAWSETTSDGVHAVLAEALTGEALTDAYVETWTAMARAATAGGEVDVVGVEYGDIVQGAGDDGAPEVDVTWWVRGVVRHQGHAHPRINQYRAIYTLTETPAGWRIGASRMVDVRRVAAGMGEDALFDDALPPSARGFVDPLELIQGSR